MRKLYFNNKKGLTLVQETESWTQTWEVSTINIDEEQMLYFDIEINTKSYRFVIPAMDMLLGDWDNLWTDLNNLYIDKINKGVAC